jgi:hypothetical protein
VRPEELGTMKKFIHFLGSRTRDLPAKCLDTFCPSRFVLAVSPNAVRELGFSAVPIRGKACSTMHEENMVS